MCRAPADGRTGTRVDTQQLTRFAETAAQGLGAEKVQGPAQGLLNDTMHREPGEFVVVRPQSTAEVQTALAAARDHGVSVHPFSTGRNWGYGSSYPASSDTRVILDLSGMNRILSFDEDLGLVTLEPGVRQGELSAFLKERGARFITPTTGAGPSVSLVGNALERGYGLTPVGDHFSAVMGIEAVLADGSMYRSPFMPEAPDGIQPAYKWGTGPYLDGLFSQAGNAIVTRMTLRLAPMPERIEAFFFSVRDDALLEVTIDAIRKMLSDSGMPISGINLVNDSRISALVGEGSQVQRAKWFGTGVVFGDKILLQACRKAIRKALKGIAKRVIFMNDDRLVVAQKGLRVLKKVGLGHRLEPLLENSAGLLSILAGTPSEFMLPTAYSENLANMPDTDRNPARDGCGLIWYVPIVPMRGTDARRYAQHVERTCRAHGFENPITFSSISSTAFDSTVPLVFTPDEEGTARAMACLRALIDEGRKLGFHPYRYHAQTMDLATAHQPDFWSAATRVKAAFDPEETISPGRYVAKPSDG